MIPITLKDGTPVRDEDGRPWFWDPDRHCAVVISERHGGWSEGHSPEAYAGSVPMWELSP